MAGSMVFSSMHSGLYMLTSIVALIWLTVVVARDRRNARRRDWVHWVGVAVNVAMPSLFVLQRVGFVFVSRAI
jgi:hypothetical protein